MKERPALAIVKSDGLDQLAYWRAEARRLRARVRVLEAEKAVWRRDRDIWRGVAQMREAPEIMVQMVAQFNGVSDEDFFAWQISQDPIIGDLSDVADIDGGAEKA